MNEYTDPFSSIFYIYGGPFYCNQTTDAEKKTLLEIAPLLKQLLILNQNLCTPFYIDLLTWIPNCPTATFFACSNLLCKGEKDNINSMNKIIECIMELGNRLTHPTYFVINRTHDFDEGLYYHSEKGVIQHGCHFEM